MNVIIIGGGPAGCEAAYRLAQEGIKIDLIEKENTTGGNLNNWYQLFPDRKNARDITEKLKKQPRSSQYNPSPGYRGRRNVQKRNG